MSSRRTTYQVASILLLSAGIAAAQSQETPPPTTADQQAGAEPAVPTSAPPGEERRSLTEEVVVTGSRIRRKDLTTPAPVTVVTREQFQASGRMTIGDFLQTMPEQGNAPNFQLNTGGIAGVVNIITRRSFDGTDLGAQYGVSGKGDAQTIDAHVTTGTSGDTAGAIFSVRYFNQQDSWLRDRTWSQQALDYDYSGSQCDPGVTRCPVVSGSSRTPQGTVQIPKDSTGNNPECNGNALCLAMVADGWTAKKRWIRDPNGPYCGPNGLGQTECFRVFTGNDFYNFAAENYLTIPSTTIQGFSSGEAKFPVARGYYELSYTQRNSTQNAAPMPLNPNDYNNNIVSKSSLYNPFGTDLDFLGRRLVEFGNRTYTEDLATFRVVTGLDGTLPAVTGPLQGWFWNATLNYGRTSGTFTTGGSFRNSRVASAVGPSMRDAQGNPVCVDKPGDLSTVVAGCTPLNLLGGPGSIASSQQDYLGFTGTSRAYDQ